MVHYIRNSVSFVTDRWGGRNLTHNLLTNYLIKLYKCSLQILQSGAREREVCLVLSACVFASDRSTVAMKKGRDLLSCSAVVCVLIICQQPFVVLGVQGPWDCIDVLHHKIISIRFCYYRHSYLLEQSTTIVLGYQMYFLYFYVFCWCKLHFIQKRALYIYFSLMPC